MAGHIAPPINVAKGATLGKIFTGTGVDTAAWQALNTAPDAGLTGRLAAPGAYAPDGIGVLVRSFADAGMFAPSAFSGYEYGLPVGGSLVINDTTWNEIDGPLTTLVPGVELNAAGLGLVAGQSAAIKLPVGHAYAGYQIHTIYSTTSGGAPFSAITGTLGTTQTSYTPGYVVTNIPLIAPTGKFFVCLKASNGALPNAHLATTYGAWQDWYH